MEKRQRERRRFTRAGLGAREDVAAFQNVRDRLRLHGRRGGVALGGDGLENGSGKTKSGKLHGFLV